jgi:ABC-2 type transport system ATP-binding protein
MIHVENVTKNYGDFRAVDGISLDVSKGEIVGLLGPNGAGKTTTLRMLTSYFQPTTGNIRVKDLSTSENPLEVKALMGYLPESAPLYQGMLVYDFLLYAAGIRGLARGSRIARLRQLAEGCGLNECMHKTVGELSKGLKQRVGLAYAMMNDPEILVLDEPTSGLDPNQIVEIREIIRRIGREKTVVLSTHILSEAEATCDRIVIINRGRIVADDSTEALKLAAGGEQILGLVLRNADFPEVEQVLGQVPGVAAVWREDNVEEGLLRVRLLGLAAEDLREPVYRRIKEQAWVLMELRKEAKTLEHVFRELTREEA